MQHSGYNHTNKSHAKEGPQQTFLCLFGPIAPREFHVIFASTSGWEARNSRVAAKSASGFNTTSSKTFRHFSICSSVNGFLVCFFAITHPVGVKASRITSNPAIILEPVSAVAVIIFSQRLMNGSPSPPQAEGSNWTASGIRISKVGWSLDGTLSLSPRPRATKS